jgi:hypothetical protein
MCATAAGGAALWTASAACRAEAWRSREHSGDGAFGVGGGTVYGHGLPAGKSGVALRFPPQSIRGRLPGEFTLPSTALYQLTRIHL